jgi:predicted  nucleic acid-binding Zn-ribbon protein
MTTDAIFDRLRALQDVLTRKIELEREITDIPKTLDSNEEMIHRLKQKYIDDDQVYVLVKQEEADTRNRLLITQGEREKSEKKMDDTTSLREVEALTKEIAEAQKKEDALQKELREVEERSRAMNEELSQQKIEMDILSQELDERKQGIEDELKDRQTKLDEVTNEEKVLEEGIDPELKFKFERIIRKKGGQGIVAVRGREHPVCQGCHMILPVQFAADVRRGEKIQSCPYCSSILYYEDVVENEDTDFLDDSEAGSLADLDDIDDDIDEEDELIPVENDFD